MSGGAPVARSAEQRAPATLAVPAGALICGLVAAMLLPGAGLGLNALIVTGCVAAAVLRPLRRRPKNPGEGTFPAIAAVLAALLGSVGVVRSSAWLVTGCLVAAVLLAGCAALRVRTWRAALLSGVLLGEAAVRSLPWAAPVTRRILSDRVLAHGRRAVATGSLVGTAVGLTVGVGCAGAVVLLLAGADPAYAEMIDRVATVLELAVPSADLLVARTIVAGLVLLLVLGLSFAAAGRSRQARAEPSPRHPGEWLIPLVMVALAIAGFLAVEATRLFGAGAAVLQETSMTHAERAREGFGQLTVVTVLVLLLLAWAGRGAAGRHRRLLAAAGGSLLLLTLLLAGSALRRLWLYQDAFGWTVTRLNAGAFELWTGSGLVAVGLAWLLRRTDLLPRLGVGSAGLGLLVLTLAGPDALVAAADVRRYERTGSIDTAYLSRLSADAVPALADLPEPVRRCALPTVDDDDAWYTWNLSRFRAHRILRTLETESCPERLSSNDSWPS